jgi:hypothetical protein
MLAALQMPAKEINVAKDLVNSQVKAWSRVGIRATDLQPKLWAMAQALTQGKIFEDGE